MTRRTTIALAWAIVIALFAVPVEAATTYYVATTGNDGNPGTIGSPWLTVQKAANTMVAGDTVFVRGGTYAERVVLATSGSAGNLITYAAYPNESPILDGTSVASVGQTAGLFSINTRSYITVSGLRIQNAKNAGISIGNAGNLIIEDCVITNVGTTTNSSAIWAEGKTGTGPTLIRRNTISSSTLGGITLWTNTGGYFLLDGNSVTLWTGTGNYDGVQANDTPYLIIRNNIVHDAAGTTGDYIDVGGNIDIAPCCLLNYTHHILAERNLVYVGSGSTTGANFKVNNHPNPAVYRLNVLEGIQFTFYQQPEPGLYLYSNTVASAGGDGHSFQFYNSDLPTTAWGTVRVKNNLVTFSTSYMMWHGNDAVDGSYGDIQVDHNVYRFSTSGIYWFLTNGIHTYAAHTSGASGIAAYNQWRTDSGQEPSGGTRTEQSLAQLYVDSTARDYHLKAGSAAIDAGGPLTTAVGSGSSSTQLTPSDWHYFVGDWATALGVSPDTVKVGSSSAVAIASINEMTGVITLASPISWSDGDFIYLGNYEGNAPDAGAYEYTVASGPTRIRIVGAFELTLFFVTLAAVRRTMPRRATWTQTGNRSGRQKSRRSPPRTAGLD